MSLVICVNCGHPANEHDDRPTRFGCLEAIYPDDPFADVLGCECNLSDADVYRQSVPPVEADE